MSDGGEFEGRLRRHLTDEADELPFLVEAETVRRHLAGRPRWRWLPILLAPATAALVLAVLIGGALLAEPGGPAEWGPLAVMRSTGGDQALSTGVLRISDRCVLLEGGDGESELLVWPAGRTRWDPDRDSIAFTNSDGTRFSLRDGEVLNVGGGGDSTAESGVSGAEWAESVDWVAAPDPACPMESRWYVGEIVAAPPDHRVELPIGSFVSVRPFDGICLALTIETPNDANIKTRWWNAGASGDCQTRTSDIVTTSADFTEPPALNVSIPTTDGGAKEFSLRFTGTYRSGLKFARNGEDEVGFGRVEVVAPTFDPVP